MAGPKDKLSPEAYDRWLARHRVKEAERVDRIKAEKNPMRLLPMEARGEMPQTYSLEEAYWHPLACSCGSCEGRHYIKDIRMATKPVPPAVKSVTARLPELPYLELLRLQAAEAEALSREG